MAQPEKPPVEKDPTRPDRAADPEHEGRQEERERLQQRARWPFEKPKPPEPPN